MKAITFNDSEHAKRAVLALAGKSVDEQGYIVESKTGERVVTQNGEEITLAKFAGMRPGSEVFFTNDLPSLLEQSEYLED